MNSLRKIKKYLNLYSILGFFFLLVGIIGIFLPLLPTTPFLLLASFLFSKGNPDFHKWLLNNKIFGPPIKDWKARGAIKLKVKCLATLMIGSSAAYIFFHPTIPSVVKILICGLFVFVLLFIWTRPNK